MKKVQLKKLIAQIGQYLETERSINALAILSDELEKYSEPKKIKPTNGGFETPKEILGKSNAFALFTDGACRGNPGPGSYGYMVQTSDGELMQEGSEAFKLTTNNQMELSGVIEGLKSLKSKVTPLDEIVVYTDSKYVVDGMKSWVAGWKKRGWKKADGKEPVNIERWQSLDTLVTICNVSFQWVKGHSGHPQNEYVDELANIVLDDNGF